MPDVRQGVKKMTGVLDGYHIIKKIKKQRSDDSIDQVPTGGKVNEF